MKHRGFIWIAVILIAGVYAPLNLMFPSQPAAAAIDHIVINEVYYYNNDWENDWENSIFIELLNPTSLPVVLSDWILETNSSGQRWRFPTGFSLGSHQMIVIFPDATEDGEFKPFDWVGQPGSLSTFVFETAASEGSDQNNTEIDDLLAVDGTGDLRFNVTGDYILLKNGSDFLIDAFVWGNNNYPGHISAPVVTGPGYSMERNWSSDYVDTDDCSVDFEEFKPPHPGQFAGEIIQTLPKQAPFAIIFAIMAILSLAVFRKRRKKN
ncbi:MAG: lamin tail domain-containing protein [Promethearchaeota archaeon]